MSTKSEGGLESGTLVLDFNSSLGLVVVQQSGSSSKSTNGDLGGIGGFVLEVEFILGAVVTEEGVVSGESEGLEVEGEDGTVEEGSLLDVGSVGSNGSITRGQF